jgi:diamine N-acetyltransferase
VPESDPVNRDSAVSLREVTHATLRKITALQVSEYQRRFVAPNALSIAEAYFERDHAWFRGIYADDTPVGFVMVYEDPVTPEYTIWRFMIDQRYQGMGFGRRAMELVLQHIASRPNAKEVRLGYHRDDGGPEGFYKKMGFENTDEMWDDEHVMVLRLAPR